MQVYGVGLLLSLLSPRTEVRAYPCTRDSWLTRGDGCLSCSCVLTAVTRSARVVKVAVMKPNSSTKTVQGLICMLPIYACDTSGADKGAGTSRLTKSTACAPDQLENKCFHAVENFYLLYFQPAGGKWACCYTDTSLICS